jgi:hypothetical protein
MLQPCSPGSGGRIALLAGLKVGFRRIERGFLDDHPDDVEVLPYKSRILSCTCNTILIIHTFPGKKKTNVHHVLEQEKEIKMKLHDHTPKLTSCNNLLQSPQSQSVLRARHTPTAISAQDAVLSLTKIVSCALSMHKAH